MPQDQAYTPKPARKKGPAKKKLKVSSFLRSRVFMAMIGIFGVIVLLGGSVIALLPGGGPNVPGGASAAQGNYYYDQALQRLNTNDLVGALAALQQAAAHYEQARQEAPQDPQLQALLGEVYLYQGWIHANLGQLEPALALWQQVIELTPDSVLAQEAQELILEYTLSPITTPQD